MALEYKFIIKDDGSAVLEKAKDSANALQKSLINVDNSTNIYGKSLSVLRTGVANFAADMAVKAVTSIKQMASEMLESYDSAAKLASNIGITTESVVGLRHAAELSNVGAEQLDKNMIKLSRSMSLAADGNKTAASAFAKMGIEVKNSDGNLKNSEQVLMEMADKFNELPPGAERATLAMDVFGKSGAGMVEMLKDGSAGLREMVDEGANSARNIEGISEAVQQFNDAGTRVKAVIAGMIASFADTDVFRRVAQEIEDLAKAWSKFAAEQKEAAQIEKNINEMNKQGAMADLKRLELKRLSMQFTEEYNNLDIKGKRAIQQETENEIKALLRKSNLTQQEITYAQSQGQIIALNKRAETHYLSESTQAMLNKANANIAMQDSQKESARIAAENAEKEKVATLAAVNSYNQKSTAIKESQRIAEEAIRKKTEAFDKAISDKEKAITSLSEFDKQNQIKWLEGEEQKQAQLTLNYEKQKAEIELLHEAELFAAADAEAKKIEQYVRMMDMERTFEIEKDAIRQEFAEIEAKRREDEEAEEKKQADKAKKELEEIRDMRLSVASSSFQALQQITEGQKKFAAVYKAAQIGEAIINSTQAVLKTMASVPFPLNIPLVALQSAAGAAQVAKISSTKMEHGGIVGGTSYYGDQVPIMANSGEMFLNRRQQKNLFDTINNNTTNNSNDNRNISSTVVVNSFFAPSARDLTKLREMQDWQNTRL